MKKEFHGKVVGTSYGCRVFYTGVLLESLSGNGDHIFQINEPGWVTFAFTGSHSGATAVFRIKWKGGVK